MKILTIVGARPQFVKLGPFSRELREKHEEVILHTGQHYDTNMSDSFFEDLGIPKPDINLNVGSGSHSKQTAEMMIGIEQTLADIKPDWVVIFGDTNSTLAGALVASKMGVPCAHIEAGLRSFNREMPEEINRVVSDHVSNLLLAPTTVAMTNLENEGLLNKSVNVGDIMVDSIKMIHSKIDDAAIDGPYDILTLHRPYNVDVPERLERIIHLMGKIGSRIVFPVHPRTRSKLGPVEGLPGNIELIDPLGYLEFQKMLKSAGRVFTDSGGLQKEAYILGKPCCTIRSESEWVETIEAGWNHLVDIDSDDAFDKITHFSPPAERPDLYGSNVAQRIVIEIESWKTN